MNIRKTWVLVHRYAGLAMAAFLIVVGITGSLLAFLNEIDGALNPNWTVSANGLEVQDPVALIEHTQNLNQQLQVDGLHLTSTAAVVSVSPPQSQDPGQIPVLAYNQIILNPYTGQRLGERQWGDLSQGISNLMPFIYKLHYELVLGDTGIWILGITALVWTFDCFVGFYLTLPPTRTASASNKPLTTKSFWQRWRPAWLVKWSASKTRINFDLHRAGGLWLWLALLVFAWSSVYMNMSGFYSAIMKSVSEFHQPWSDFPDLPQPVLQPQIGWQQAQNIAQAELKQLEKEQNIKTTAASGFWLNRAKGFYVYAVKSSADIQDQGGNTRVVIDANSGKVMQLLLPTGQYGGNTITSWLLALHMANVWGLPYRIFVCVLGLVITMLSVTGILIWLKKRQYNRRKI